MDFEIKTSEEEKFNSEQGVNRPWWIILLIVVGLLLVAWFAYSLIRGLASPDEPTIVDITAPLEVNDVSSVVGRVISLKGDELIINAIAETNFLEEDTLIVIILTEDTRYFNHITFSSTIVESGKNEIAVGDEVVAKGGGNVKGKEEFEAETLTIIVR